MQLTGLSSNNMLRAVLGLCHEGGEARGSQWSLLDGDHLNLWALLPLKFKPR